MRKSVIVLGLGRGSLPTLSQISSRQVEFRRVPRTRGDRWEFTANYIRKRRTYLLYRKSIFAESNYLKDSVTGRTPRSVKSFFDMRLDRGRAEMFRRSSCCLDLDPTTHRLWSRTGPPAPAHHSGAAKVRPLGWPPKSSLSLEHPSTRHHRLASGCGPRLQSAWQLFRPESILNRGKGIANCRPLDPLPRAETSV